MKYNKFSFVLCALTALVMAGCNGDQEGKHHYDNKVFISATSFSREMRINEFRDDMTHQLSIQMAKLENRDITVTLAADADLLDKYRQAYYDEDVLMLPEKHYDLSEATVTIEVGKVAANPLSLTFANLDELDLDMVYVLPVTVASASIDVLASARTLYYVFKEASLVNVVAGIKTTRLFPGVGDGASIHDKTWKDPTPVTDMTTFTLEALIYANDFADRGGDASISTVMGIEDLFLIRIGDALLPKNQIQVAYAVKGEDTTARGAVTDASLALTKERWYHIAVTFDNGAIVVYLDGTQRASGTVTLPISKVNFGVAHSDESDSQPRCFWIGYSYDEKRYLDGLICEARIWNKALTAEEVNDANHFYKVDPASEGLVAYWKFDDEGSENVVKDHTVYGNDLWADTSDAEKGFTELKWYPVALPEKNN